MAVTFFIRTKAASGTTHLFARYQHKEYNLNLRAKTSIQVDIKSYLNIKAKDGKGKASETKANNYYTKNPDVKVAIDDIIKEVDVITNKGAISITSSEFQTAIHNALTRDLKAKQEEERLKAEAEETARLEAIRLKEIEDAKQTFVEYVEIFIQGASDGTRKYEKNNIPTAYKPNSVRNLRQTLRWLRKYQAEFKTTLYFENIDKSFSVSMVDYMEREDSSINTIGVCIKDIKAFMEAAFIEGKHFSLEYKKFRSFKVNVDTIALTEDEVKMLEDVDLSNMHPCYEIARDLWLIGMHTAQRVSDYGKIKKENIKMYKVKAIEGDRIVEKQVYIYSIPKQQKTDGSAAIPVKTKFLELINKYDYNFPRLADQKLNEYIKVVAERAGITDMETITKRKGGKEIVETHPRWQLISSHTARRTGATLMFLAGIDIYDIMVATGHKSIKTLENYLKVKAEARALVMAQKYSYFQF